MPIDLNNCSDFGLNKYKGESCFSTYNLVNKSLFSLRYNALYFIEEETGLLIFRPHLGQLLLPLLLHGWEIQGSSFQTIPFLSPLPQEQSTRPILQDYWNLLQHTCLQKGILTDTSPAGCKLPICGRRVKATQTGAFLTAPELIL